MGEKEPQRKVIKVFRPCQVTDSMTCDRDEKLLSKCGLDDNGSKEGCPFAINYLERQSLEDTGQDVRLEFVRNDQIEAIVESNTFISTKGIQRGSVYDDITFKK